MSQLIRPLNFDDQLNVRTANKNTGRASSTVQSIGQASLDARLLIAQTLNNNQSPLISSRQNNGDEPSPTGAAVAPTRSLSDSRRYQGNTQQLPDDNAWPGAEAKNAGAASRRSPISGQRYVNIGNQGQEQFVIEQRRELTPKRKKWKNRIWKINSWLYAFLSCIQRRKGMA